MCIVIDACCANRVAAGKLPQSKLVLDWVKAGGTIVSGGRLENELRGTALQRLIVQWSRSGNLQSIDKPQIEREIGRISLENVRSNDLHVLALVRLTGSKVVITTDNELTYDLKRSGQVPTGRKIYPCPETAVTNLRVQRGVLRNSGCK